MTRARDNRLARLAKEAANDDNAKSRDRCLSATWRKVCAIVREELMRSGIDPARVPALRLCEAHQGSEVNPSREEFVQPDGDALAATFVAKISNIARRYENGHELNFAKASMAELFAWSLSRRAARAGGAM